MRHLQIYEGVNPPTQKDAYLWLHFDEDGNKVLSAWNGSVWESITTEKSPLETASQTEIDSLFTGGGGGSTSGSTSI